MVRMCGRATNHENLERMMRRMGVDTSDGEPWVPSYNIAPTQPIPVVGVREGARALRAMRWGLIPSWAKDARTGAQCINARAETVGEKPAFRSAFKHRRCAVLVTGWYEWARVGAAKIPHWFHAADREVLALAGLWELWVDKATGAEVRSCSIVTTEPNAMAAAVHDRMPVVLSDAGLARWLTPTSRDRDAEARELGALRELLVACPDAVLDVWPVDKRVGSPRNNDPSLIERAGAERAA